MEKFKIRPGYDGSKEMLFEFCGDHRAPNYPKVWKILKQALKAKQIKHPRLDVVRIGVATDEYISYWECEAGAYEIDDDIWTLVIFLREHQESAIPAIRNALLSSGAFEQEPVDSTKYG